MICGKADVTRINLWKINRLNKSRTSADLTLIAAHISGVDLW